jgi:hypothetical protein
MQAACRRAPAVRQPSSCPFCPTSHRLPPLTSPPPQWQHRPLNRLACAPSPASSAQERQGEEGGPRCELCCEGLQEVESILGCRTPAGRDGRKEYFVKWKGRGYR